MEDNRKKIIEHLKKSGLFDQFRKDCIADVDTKPAYINLQDRVNRSVSDYLKKIPWSSKLSKLTVREAMRKHIMDSPYFIKGVDRVVDQAVDQKVNTAFYPVVENVVYEILGLPKPNEVSTSVDDEDQRWEEPMDLDTSPEESKRESPEPDVPPPLVPGTSFQEDSQQSQQSMEVVTEMDYKIESEEINGSDENGVTMVVTEEISQSEFLQVKDEVSQDSVNASSQENTEIEIEEDEESPPFEAIGLLSPVQLHTPVSNEQSTGSSNSNQLLIKEESVNEISPLGTELPLVTNFSECFIKPEDRVDSKAQDESLTRTPDQEALQEDLDTSLPIITKVNEEESRSSSRDRHADTTTSSSGQQRSNSRDKQRSENRSHDKSRSHDRDKGKERGRERSRDRDRYRDKDRDKGRDRDRDREKDRNRDRDRDRERDRDRDRDKDRDSRRKESSSSRQSSQKSSSKYSSSRHTSHSESSRRHSSDKKKSDDRKDGHSSRHEKSSSGSTRERSPSKSSSRRESDRYKSKSSSRHSDRDRSSHKSRSTSESQTSQSVKEEGSTDVTQDSSTTYELQPRFSSQLSQQEELTQDKWYSGQDSKQETDNPAFASPSPSPPKLSMEYDDSAPVSPNIKSESVRRSQDSGDDDDSRPHLETNDWDDDTSSDIFEHTDDLPGLLKDLNETINNKKFYYKQQHFSHLKQSDKSRTALPLEPAPASYENQTISVQCYPVTAQLHDWLVRHGARVHVQKNS